MDSAIHTFYLHNGRPVDRRYFLASSAERQLAVYEVIRLAEGVPLFLEDHVLRMVRSARLVGRVLDRTLEDIEKNIRKLMEVNQVTEGNIKLQMQWMDREPGDLFACFIPHRYPTGDDYRQGVSVGFLEAERDNPNAKVVNLRVREEADARLRETGNYEVLLVDHDGFVTEGSRSNFFVIRGDDILTPPVSTVLPGITRGKVLEIAIRQGRPVRQESLRLLDLKKVDAAFLSGTSPGVLPIARMDGVSLNPQYPLLQAIHEDYEQLVREYIRTHEAVGPTTG